MDCNAKNALATRVKSIGCKLGSWLPVVALAVGLGSVPVAPAHAASFKVTYSDGASEGFFDSSLGGQRRAAFEASLSYWSAKLGASPVEINVDASFDPLGGDANSATLGQAGAVSVFRDFANSNPEFKSGTFYGSALANHLAGRDMDTTQPEIRAKFNSDVDGPTVLGAEGFYYGLDSNPPTNCDGDKDSDFYTVSLHELGHGLNFFDLINSNGTYLNPPNPGVYETFLTQGNGASRTRLTAMTDAQRGAAIISNDLFFDGPLTQNANGGPAKMFAPNPYQGGSSVSHLDENTYPGLNPNNLLTPSYSGPFHDAGPVALAIFDDMGWGIDSPPVVTSITRLDASPTSARSVRFQVLFYSPVIGVDATDFTLSATGNITGAGITSISGSGASYIVTVGSYSGSEGTLKLNVVDNDSISDAGSGAKLGGTGSGNGSFTTGDIYTFTLPSSGGIASLFSSNTLNDAVLRTNPPSLTPSRAASLTQANAISRGVVRAGDGTLYLTTNLGLITRIPLSPGSTTSYGTATNLPANPNLLSIPWDIVLGSDGMLYVSNDGNGAANSKIVKVNPSTGVQTLLASGGSLNRPRGLTFGADGALYCSNLGGDNAGNSTILRIDASSGAQSTFALIAGYDDGINIFTPQLEGLAFGPDGSLYLSDTRNNRIVKRTSAGVQTDLVAFGALPAPHGLTFASDSSLYVASGNDTSGKLVKIDAFSGAQTVVASGGEINAPSDVIAVAAPLPDVSVSGAPQITEGDSGTSLATFTLTRTGNTGIDSSVTVATADGTASAGSDYVAISPTIYTFVAGDSAPKTISVTINGDISIESDETFTLNISSPVGATIATATATGTIVNDDLNTAPTFVNAPYTFAFTQDRPIQGVKVDATDAQGDSFTFAISGGALPTGVTFNADGTFSGTPTVTSSAITRTVTVTDARGASATTQVTLSVSSGKGALISEFRFRGQNGTGDEFVEIYNTLGTPLDISGWSLKTRTFSNGSTIFQSTGVPANTTIPARGHFLFAGNTYSLTSYGIKDASIAGDMLDSSGAALLDASGATQDAVGFSGSDASLREGSGLPNVPGVDGEYSFVRAFAGTLPKDTPADSSQDFVFVSTTGSSVTGTPASLVSQLGAPSPQGLGSPLLVNGGVTTVLFDAGAGANLSPNRVRTGSGNSGTLLVRRTLLNKTGKEITKIRFSVTKITSLGSPVSLINQADVRLITLATINEEVALKGGGTKTVSGTTLESGTNQPAQPLGGALGSSVIFNLTTPIPIDGSRSYSFLLDIKKSGNFAVSLNIKAITTP